MGGQCLFVCTAQSGSKAAPQLHALLAFEYPCLQYLHTVHQVSHLMKSSGIKCITIIERKCISFFISKGIFAPNIIFINGTYSVFKILIFFFLIQSSTMRKIVSFKSRMTLFTTCKARRRWRR